MKPILLLIMLFMCNISFGQLTTKKEFGQFDRVSLNQEGPILRYQPTQINLYLEKPRPRKHTDENKTLKKATIIGGIVFGGVLTLNYLGTENRKDENTEYWLMMGGITALCVTVQIAF